MRDILITLAGALLSLFLLVSLMTPQSTQHSVSRPNTEDAGKHGMKALRTWLEENGIHTVSLRRPVSRLEQEALPATGNIMVISLPLARDPLDTEWRALNEWISRGNSAMVLASLYHIPEWSGMLEWLREDEIIDAISGMTAEAFTLYRDDVERLESEFSLSDMQASIRAFKPASYQLYPAVEHTLFDGVQWLDSDHTPGMYQFENDRGEAEAVYWSIDSESARLALRLMSGELPEQTAMWLLPVGSGWVYLSAFPELLGNSMLKQPYNARWFENLLSHTVADGGYVIFDDYHFGLSDLYDPEAFFSDDRLHNSLLFIGAFWLIYALGRSPRLAPVRKAVARPANRDFIEAMAGFFTRRISSRAIARELAEYTLDDIGSRTQLEGDELWNWLHDHPRMSEHDILRLQLASGHMPGKTKLMQLSRSIHRIQKVLS